MKKSELIPGKWYKNNLWWYHSYVKFVKLDNNNSRLDYSEKIDNNFKYSSDSSWCMAHESGLEKATLEEVSKYLPDGHPDKIKENMKAKIFRILGTPALIKAMSEELKEIGYDISEFDSTYNGICHNMSKNTKESDFSKEDYIELFNDIDCDEAVDVIFTLPAQYNEVLEFAKEQLSDKYWVKTPKFKVGDYVCDFEDDSEHIGRIYKIEDDKYYYWGFNIVGDFKDETIIDWYSVESCSRLATEEEIKEFLIRVAKKKGLVKGTKFNTVNSASLVIGECAGIVNDKWTYSKSTDTLSNRGNIYSKGVWATIIPSEIKLPFGNFEFTINKKLQTATCKEGVITKQQIQEIVDWWDKDFTLLGYKMQIIVDGKLSIKFGCCEGSVAEIKAILKAFN